jgi:hypothetical protein
VLRFFNSIDHIKIAVVIMFVHKIGRNLHLSSCSSSAGRTGYEYVFLFIIGGFGECVYLQVYPSALCGGPDPISPPFLQASLTPCLFLESVKNDDE